METIDRERKAELVREYRRHCNGFETLREHWLGLRYSDGIHYVAEVCGAHWLIDLVASHQPKIQKRLGLDRDFQVWRLDQTRTGGWRAEAWTDTPGADGSRKLASQSFGYSDFPAELCPFGFLVEHGTLLLKEER